MTIQNTLIIALSFLCLVGTMNAQKTGAPPVEREYRLQALYRAGIAQNYEVVEQSTVERTHSDSSKNLRAHGHVLCDYSLY